MVKKLTVLFTLLFAAPVMAEFTAAEKTQLTKINTVRVEVAAQLRNLSDAITHSQIEATRPQFYQAALAGLESSYDCHQAIRHLFNSAPDLDPFALEPAYTGVPRTEAVQRGFNYVSSCNAKTANFASKLISTGQAALANPRLDDPLSNHQATVIIGGGQRLQDPNVNALSTFNTSLTYTVWQPAGYPNVIGPHGDYDFAQIGIDHADLKWLEVLKDVTLFYGNAVNWNDKANVGYREMLAYGADALGLFARVWYINAGMVARFPDQQAIDADFAFSSGLRPKSFFATLRAFELVNSPDPHLHGLGGRNLAAGITGQFAVVLDQLGEMLQGFGQNNGIDAMNAALNMSGGQTSFVTATSATGKVREAHVDLAQAWMNLETFNTGEFLFFRPPTPPPAGGCPTGQTCQLPPPPPVTCAAGTHLVGNQCEPDPCPTCPPPVTCGAGAHLEGTVCVADPPPICPEFTPELAILNDRIEARCVVQ